jgi:hypothetical protein
VIVPPVTAVVELPAVIETAPPLREVPAPLLLAIVTAPPSPSIGTPPCTVTAPPLPEVEPPGPPEIVTTPPALEAAGVPPVMVAALPVLVLTLGNMVAASFT